MVQFPFELTENSTLSVQLPSERTGGSSWATVNSKRGNRGKKDSSWFAVFEKFTGNSCCVEAKAPCECIEDSSSFSIGVESAGDACCAKANCYAGDARRGGSRSKKSGTTHEKVRGARDMSLGLPRVDRDYEPDPDPFVHGSFGRKLSRYTHKQTRTPRAVIALPKKHIPKDILKADLEKQLELLCKIDHPNIVAFQECCEDRKNFYLVYEWCEGGLFMHQLWEYEEITEGHIAYLARDILSALDAANAFGVQHLDLSLYALFLHRKGALNSVKVFGFGLAGFLRPPVSGRGKSDSNKHYYAAPEIFRISSGYHLLAAARRHACDMWSVGALIYTLLCGKPPFQPGSLDEYEKNVSRGYFSFDATTEDYSMAAMNLIEQTLILKWEKRLTACEALSHPWVALTAAHTRNMQLDESSISCTTLKQLGTFAQTGHVERVLARMFQDMGGLSSKDIATLEGKFRSLDHNGDGAISLEELLESADVCGGVAERQIQTILCMLDRNDNNSIDISEFMTALALQQEATDERVIKKMFRQMDDGDARLTEVELFKILRTYSGSLEIEEVSDFIAARDLDGDRHIGYEEFKAMFPRCTDYQREIDTQKAEMLALIKSGPQYLQEFEKKQVRWMTKVDNHAKKIAAGRKKYLNRQITEYDAQTLVNELHQVLQSASAQNARRERRKHKDSPKTSARSAESKEGPKQGRGRNMERTQGKDSSRSSSRNQSQSPFGTPRPGTPTLAAASSTPVIKHSVSTGGRQNRKIPTIPSDGNSAKSASIVEHCLKRIDHEQELNDEDSAYEPRSYILDSLRCLIMTKCEHVWQMRVREAIKEAQDTMCDDLEKIEVVTKIEARTLAEHLDKNLNVRETVWLSRGFIMQGSRLRPMGSLAGFDFNELDYRDKLTDMVGKGRSLILYFSTLRPGVSSDDYDRMQHAHAGMLEWALNYAGEIVSSVGQLCRDVETDMAMSGSFETSLPSQPPHSDPYLRYCQGRASTFHQEQPGTPGGSSRGNSSRGNSSRNSFRDRPDTPGGNSTMNSTVHFSADDAGGDTKNELDEDLLLKRLERNCVLRKGSRRRLPTESSQPAEVEQPFSEGFAASLSQSVTATGFSIGLTSTVQ